MNTELVSMEKEGYRIAFKSSNQHFPFFTIVIFLFNINKTLLFFSNAHPWQLIFFFFRGPRSESNNGVLKEMLITLYFLTSNQCRHLSLN